MNKHLYRFRPADALLDRFNELEKQEVYFCPPVKLNDPLEGFRDIYWRGDLIIWTNFFRHYALCLMQATSVALLLGKEFSSQALDNVVHQIPEDLPEAPIRQIYNRISEAFVESDAVKVVLNAFTDPMRTIRRDGLLFYIRILHVLAINCVIDGLGERGLLIVEQGASLSAGMDGIEERLINMTKLHFDNEELSEMMYPFNEELSRQLGLVHQFNQPIPEEKRAWAFIVRDFPAFYLNSLEKLMFPDWHTACFVADPTNASMWGSYGDSHRGVCLKFAVAESQGKSSLELYRATGWGGGKDGWVTHYGYVAHLFEEVKYTSEFPEIDFFESLGSVPRYKLANFWYAGPNGQRSVIANRVMSENEEWRANYWENFLKGQTVKSAEWAHEKEHRLTLFSSMQPFDKEDDRKLKYKFSSLSGIVFGIRTSDEDKLRIIRIVAEKCKAEGRSDFEFFQAHYSHSQKKIVMLPLQLLGKFT